MEINDFKNLLEKYANMLDIELSEKEIDLFYQYMKLLLEWNTKMNLTAITEEKDVILKHFIDSISIEKYLQGKNRIMDIGTGAGFPGIPLKILNQQKKLILVDSLNKRIQFLEEVKKELVLNNLELIHSRVEDLAKDSNYRESADVAVSRAVANLRVLVEYMLPFVKKEGIVICMKGPNIEEEIEEAKNAIEILGGKIENIDNIQLPENLERNIVIIKKVKDTPSKRGDLSVFPGRKEDHRPLRQRPLVSVPGGLHHGYLGRGGSSRRDLPPLRGAAHSQHRGGGALY